VTTPASLLRPALERLSRRSGVDVVDLQTSIEHASRDVFKDGIERAARGIARGAEASADVPDQAISDFIVEAGWMQDRDAWSHPHAGIRWRRVDALAWSLVLHRRQSGQWPAFCQSSWRAP
jgi:hypothetical protein